MTAHSDLLAALGPSLRPNVLQLSRELGLARNTVQARLDRLDRDGVVSGFEPVVDLAALGYTVTSFTTLEIAQGQERSVLHGLASIAEVIEAHKITAPGDLLCRIVARTTQHLHDVLERLLALPGVARTASSLVLTSPIDHTRADAAAIARLLP